MRDARGFSDLKWSTLDDISMIIGFVRVLLLGVHEFHSLTGLGSGFRSMRKENRMMLVRERLILEITAGTTSLCHVVIKGTS